jgi:hypothetical protein
MTNPTQNDPSGDLATLAITKLGDQPYRLELLHPSTQQPIAFADGRVVTFFVRSNESDTVQQYNYDTRAKALKGRLSVEGKDIFERELEHAARLLTGWEHVEWKGSPLEFSLENAKMILRHLPFARVQIENVAAQTENFLGN